MSILGLDGAGTTETLLGLIVLLPFLGSLCVAFLPSTARNAASTLAGLVALACVLMLASLRPLLADEGVVRVILPWLPQFGLNLYLRMDGYAWLFAMLVTFMGGLVAVYARYYLSPADPVPRFFAFLLAFMGAMLGIVLSGNLIQLAMFWELTSLTSFVLIAYWYHLRAARAGARMALTVTAAGGFCLLAGVLMLGHIAGSYDLDRVLAAGAEIRAHAWYPAILVLILLGALTKSAQFPFHFWLPHAMAAPTPVSAYLHSATMVKAGVFLLARLWPVLAGTDLWFWIVCGAGLVVAVARRARGALSARHERRAGVFDDQSPGIDHFAPGHEHSACVDRCGVSHDEPCHIQGLTFHGCWHRRPRDRHARSAAPERSLACDADHGYARYGRRSGHGRRSAAQWISIQGNVFRRNDLLPAKAPSYVSACRRLQPSPACSALPIRCASFIKFSLDRSHRICRARRASRAADSCCQARCWCWPVCWSAFCRSRPWVRCCTWRDNRSWALTCPRTAWLCGTG